MKYLNTNNNFIKVFYSLLFFSSSLIYSYPINSKSLEWQRIELQQSISDKIKNVLSPIIKSGEFIVHVDIDLNSNSELTPPEGGGNPPPPPGGDDNKDKNKKPQIKFSDVDVKESSYDFIVFSKLGLEAPVYQVNDDGKIVFPNQDNPPAPTPQSIAKEMIELTKAIDLFQYLSSIKITIGLDDYLGDETKKTVEDLIKSMSFKFGKIEAIVDIKFIDMQEIKKSVSKIDPNIKRKETLEMLSKFGTAIGIVLAVVLLGLFSYLLFKKYADLQEKMMNLMRDQMNQEKVEKETEAKDETEEEFSGNLAGGPGDLGSDDQANQIKGIDRFRNLLENSSVEASLQIKKWLKANDKSSQNALILLVQELSTKELSLIFQNLSQDERDDWKKLLSRSLSPQEFMQAQIFVASEIVQEYLSPSFIQDSETIDLLLSLTPKRCADFLNQNLMYANILMNALSTKFINQLLPLINKESLDQVIQESIYIDKDNIQKNLQQFKQDLRPFVAIEKRSQFMGKILEILPQSNAAQEKSLFKGLAASGSDDLLTKIAFKNFPSELIPKVKDESLKRILSSFNRELRVDLIMTVQASLKEKYTELIAPANSKARDMLNLDMEKYQDEIALKKLQSRSDEIWMSYVKHIRKSLNKDEQLQAELRPIIEEWSKALVNQIAPNGPATNSSDNVVDMKKAA